MRVPGIPAGALGFALVVLTGTGSQARGDLIYLCTGPQYRASLTSPEPVAVLESLLSAEDVPALSSLPTWDDRDPRPGPVPDPLSHSCQLTSGPSAQGGPFNHGGRRKAPSAQDWPDDLAIAGSPAARIDGREDLMPRGECRRLNRYIRFVFRPPRPAASVLA